MDGWRRSREVPKLLWQLTPEEWEREGERMTEEFCLSASPRPRYWHDPLTARHDTRDAGSMAGLVGTWTGFT